MNPSPGIKGGTDSVAMGTTGRVDVVTSAVARVTASSVVVVTTGVYGVFHQQK